MGDINKFFTSSYLRSSRDDAKKLGVKLPKGIYAYKVGRNHYEVGADGERPVYVDGYDASEAKSKFIDRLINRAFPEYGDRTAEEIAAAIAEGR